ncbi:AraC family transcriptional regulator [Hylemonella sp. W303a]|uniref:AraC family transcriptional regulator n=1 Tax=Hylemonella sp. W303a TaxID=3389873 RepID=UPI00396B005A
MQNDDSPRLSTDNRLHRLSWHQDVELFDASFQGHPFGRHAHDAYAIGVIEQGVGGYLYRGGTELVPAGMLSLINPDEMHDGYAVQGALQYKMLYVGESSMRDILGLAHPQKFHLSAARDHGLQVRQALRIVHAALHGDPKHTRPLGWQLAVDTALTQMLQTVMQHHARNAVRPAGREPEAVRRVRHYLDELALRAGEGRMADDSGGDVTLRTLGQLVNLRPNYLLNVFTRHVGLPPHLYWMGRRITAAKRLLAQGLAIADVGYALGFHDQAHFTRTFKKFTGITPGRLRVH